MTYLLIIGMGILGLRLAVLAYNLISNPRLKRPPDFQPSGERLPISVLIPVRNEAAILPVLWAQLDCLTPSVAEILLLDDQSEDQTRRLIESACVKRENWRLIKGAPLPPGWLGKNWACHQLGLAAKGQYLLFLDADTTWVHPDFPALLLWHFEREKLALLSLFPDQDIKGVGERLTVPLMHYLLLSWLPLKWVNQSRMPAFAAANGQCMCFDGTTYRRERWHARVKASPIEDMAIIRRIKTAGMKGMTLLANGYLRNRMYHTYRSAIEGFSKNLLPGFQNSYLRLGVYLIMTQFIWLPVIAFAPTAWLLATALGYALLRIGVSLLARQSVWKNLVVYPLQMFTFTLIACWSAIRFRTKTLQWKGRNVS